MKKEDILNFLRGKVSFEGYEQAKSYMESKGKILGLFNRKFDLKLTAIGYQYIISCGLFDRMIVS